MNKIEEFESKLISVDEALFNIHSNQRVVLSMAATEPQGFLSKICDRASQLENIELHCANPSSDYPCFTDKSLDGKLEMRVMFLTSAIRDKQGKNVHYIPQHLSQWSEHLRARGKIDVFWGSCTPPDERGFVSLSLGACYETEMINCAEKVILEVNDQLPQTFGATTIPLSRVDHFVLNPHPVPTLPESRIDEIDEKIAGYVSELVEDESTIQLGIGGIPNALVSALKDKKDLGIHTEMINDAMMKMYESGAVTNRKKSLWPGKILGAFIYGSQKLYDFVHQNSIIELQPASIVNDPYVIGRNYKMTSINTAVELDLTGQICSESIGHREISGVGGAADTHTGAQRSVGGRGIIALRSTTSKGDRSKIVFELMPGAKVSISRNDVDTVVTEYGIAQLKGRSVATRATSLINIAHPNFRDELLFQARSVGYI